MVIGRRGQYGVNAQRNVDRIEIRQGQGFAAYQSMEEKIVLVKKKKFNLALIQYAQVICVWNTIGKLFRDIFLHLSINLLSLNNRRWKALYSLKCPVFICQWIIKVYVLFKEKFQIRFTIPPPNLQCPKSPFRYTLVKQ